MSNDVIINAEKLRKTYQNSFEAVRELSFSVHKGETFGLLGPNGAGKTTTIEILAGLRKRTSGYCSVLGLDPGRAGRSWRSRIGMVAQTKHDHESWRLDELLGLLAASYKNSLDPIEALELVGLTKNRSSIIGNLSGGMRRRFEVAAGIIGQPEILFLDEPTTGFDPEARRTFWHFIRSLNEKGTTVLLTTHYLDEAEALADRVLVIAEGQQKAIGRPEELGNAEVTSVSWVAADGKKHEVLTAESTHVVSKLVSSGEEISNLQVKNLSLEDRYLKLIEQGEVNG